MATIAKVVVEISLDREFDYRIPAELQSSIQVGSQVVIPFHSRELRGFVVGLSNYSAFADKLKDIAGVVGDKPLIPDPIMKLAYWIADYYCAPIEHAVRTVLPSAVRKRGAKHKKQLFVSLVNHDSVVAPHLETKKSCAPVAETKQDAPLAIDYFDLNEPVAHLGGNLPQWLQDGTTYFVTFRLADSLPQEKLNQWSEEQEEWLRTHPEPHDEVMRREFYEHFPHRFQQWLDQGMGSCILSKTKFRMVVEDALTHFDGEQYNLGEFVVMPNHVHLLLNPFSNYALSEILYGLKVYMAKKINALLADPLESVWSVDSFDHMARSPEQIEKIRKYIQGNPTGFQPEIVVEKKPNVLFSLPAGPALSKKQQEVVAILQTHGSIRLSELKDRAGCSDSPIKTLQKNGVVSIEEETIQRDPHAGMELLKTMPFDLMVEQQTALDVINAAMDQEKPGTVLLHGVTGSGKTEVYLQAIQHALDQGKGAIVLVPEIALTPQTVDRFRSRFGDCVGVLHSNLSEGERHDEWHRIRNGEARIAIGARSALFAPVDNPGLIVVDEEHEPTYKQDESPRYNARDVAVMRGHLEKCCVLLGSATPALESFKNVKDGRYVLAEMLQRVDDRSMPLMRVVDMRIEAEKDGRAQIFSAELVQGMYDRLNCNEQVILFLNRRGFSSSIQCDMCGYVAECKECSVSMTYHKGAKKLLCHICGAEAKVPDRCPNCKDPNFKYSGMGTEKIEEVLAKLCPSARVARMDSDTMRKKDSYRKVLDQFKVGKIDILLGTQMIAKGLDFPNVTLVGVLHADMSLNVPDFRAGERTFQLLTQVAGRAGRGEKAGEVIVQAYTPHHPAIQAARSLDYEGFCAQDLEFRKELAYPPFSHLVLLTFKGESEMDVIATADSFYERLEQILPESVSHSPPMPAPLARAKGHWRYQIMLRCEHTVKVTRPIKYVQSVSRLPKGVTCIVDVDALSLL